MLTCMNGWVLIVINLPHTFSVTPSPGARKYVIEASSGNTHMAHSLTSLYHACVSMNDR
jgi:hypothetical protein